MKGLLLKDFYMAKKYCRSTLLIVLVFFAVALSGADNLFFLFYPCLIAGMIPMSLCAYDERSHWNQYSGGLPYTKAQMVSAKYLIGLLAQLSVFVFCMIAFVVRMCFLGSADFCTYAAALVSVFGVSLISSSLPLPFIFRFGVEKGRLAMYVILGFFSAVVVFFSISADPVPIGKLADFFPLILFLAGIVVYVISWYLSVVLYDKREE